MLRSTLRVLSVVAALVTVVAVVALLVEAPADRADAAASALPAGRTVDQAAARADETAAVQAAAQQAAAAEAAAAAAAAQKAAAAKAAADKAAAEKAAARRKAAEKAAKAARAQAAAERASRAAARDPRALGQAMAADRGWTGSQWRCLNSLWTKESNWKVTADNPTSSAYGIPQALPGSKMSSAGRDWRTNPATQIQWGLDYIADIYGTPCGAWSHSRAMNWY